MISLFDISKVGIDPSPSYTVGPVKTGKQFISDLAGRDLLDSVTRAIMDVYGSLSLVGKGHHTSVATIMGLAGNEPATVDIDGIPGFVCDVEECECLLLAQRRHEMDFPRDSGTRLHNGNLPLHKNGMQIHVYNGDEVVYSKAYYSIGGGFIVDEEHFGQDTTNEVSVPHPFKSITELLACCNEAGFPLSGLVMQNELTLHNKKEINRCFVHVWQAIQTYIDRGMNTEGVLPGPLCIPRRASALRRMLVSSDKLPNNPINVIDRVNMLALAVNEENAAGGRMIIVPTNSACDIVPVVLAHYDHFVESASPDICTYCFVATDVIGALYKMNVSIPGAKVGCQGEVSVACPMIAAGLAGLLGDSPEQACVTAGIGMKHNLDLTYDPVTGQVQVPCIERNAIVSVRAINAARIALHRTSALRASLNKVIETMYEAGKDMNAKYCKASRGGLAIKVQCD